MKYVYITLLAVCFLFSKPVIAGEGMWLPHLLAALNLDEMQSMGMKMSAEDIYSVNQGSLKDAIVHFGGFCTGEIISKQGLILTNHHCGYGQIQSHTTLEKNLLRDGFWAYKKSDELPNPGLFVRFIRRIEDVSEQVFEGVDPDQSATERQSIIDKNLDALKDSYALSAHESIAVRPFFKGNQYILFVMVEYPDVRLVGTPPESIGKYGHDTDNWVWPRHTGDFSLFRVYAGPDGEPAEYASENVPLTPNYALPVSLDGVEEGDFTLVFGFPGSTDEYLPATAVDIIANQINPARIGIRESAMNVMDKAMKSDETIKIQYASKFARLTNYWKKWIGESKGLKRTNAISKKKAYEADYTKKIAGKKKLKKQYEDVLPELNETYVKMAPYQIAQAVHSEAFSRNIEFISLGNAVDRLLRLYENNGQDAFENALPRFKNALADRYKDVNMDVDKGVFKALMEDYLKYMPVQFVPNELRSSIVDMMQQVDRLSSSPSLNPDQMLSAMDDPEELKRTLVADPIRSFISKVNTNYDTMVAQPMAQLDLRREELMSLYMKAQMEALGKEKTFYPDANGTLRVTYGQVSGYEPRDGVYYKPVTYLSGVIEKYEPGDWEFDLPERLITIYESGDFGEYAVNGDVPVCFIGSNHTTGGNSGSPAIDAEGNLIGLNFDRVWEGTMSDYNYDASICRNIMVDVRYILFIIDKYAGAQNIIDELNLVHPKK